LRREKLSVSEVANTIFIQSVSLFQKFNVIRAGIMWGEVLVGTAKEVDDLKSDRVVNLSPQPVVHQKSVADCNK
jgi:hypothetical protein